MTILTITSLLNKENIKGSKLFSTKIQTNELTTLVILVFNFPLAEILKLITELPSSFKHSITSSLSDILVILM